MILNQVRIFDKSSIDIERANNKTFQRKKRYEQKMIETKSISESVSLSSNMVSL